MNLHGKAVLITGARRIGAELAPLLAQRGACVALTYHTSREPTEKLVAELKRGGAEAMAVGADLASADEAQAAVVKVAEQFGRLDVLVNMASVYQRTPFADLNPADFDRMIAANLAAPYHASISAAWLMLQNPAGPDLKGKIVTLGDWATERPYKNFLPYLVAKGALKTMTLALAQELAPHITVNLVEPGPIAPPPELSEVQRAQVLAETPLRRFGAPCDANNLILYLLEGTDFATGSVFRVDGGRFLGRLEE
ncbi:MAG TPA: SDR family oxidoreductase [Isosphaeraceae bacterium]|nr:SDR family oxidoreductase [Isosphaeraceae bacterium]